jgi:hypothetical protein
MQLKSRITRLQRSMRVTNSEKDCICFPPDEPPGLELPVEIEAARAVRCPLHGERFSKLALNPYRVITLPYHLSSDWRKWHSQQYIRAMDASFPPDRWRIMMTNI